MERRSILLLLTIAGYICAIAMSLLPGSVVHAMGLSPPWVAYSHFIEFTILGGLTYLTFRSYRSNAPVVNTILLVLSASLITETAQLWVPGRTADLMDVSVNLLSGTGSALIAGMLSRPVDSPGSLGGGESA
ncbi:MAG: VanZ family protein [Candidatus Brocadiia bacterium]